MNRRNECDSSLTSLADVDDDDDDDDDDDNDCNSIRRISIVIKRIVAAATKT